MSNQKTKKILFVSRPLSPPWDEASKNLAYFLAKNISDFQIGIMVKKILPEVGKNIVQNQVYTTSEISEFNWTEKLRSLFFQWKARGKFDVNHYFFTPTKLNTFLIKNFLKIKKTKSIQTVATLREDLWSDEDLKKLLFAEKIITYSDYSKNKLEKLGFSGVERIYPGIDLEIYQKRPKDSKLLSQLGIGADDFVITYPGEYTRLGATDLIVEAFQGLEQKIKNAKLILACRVKNEKDQKKKEEIAKKIKAWKISDRVIFLDTFSEMSKIYNLSELVIFPVSNMRGKFDVPLVIPEAQASRKPVIVSDLPILKEFANPTNSVIIKKDNPKELEQAIFDLYEHPEKRESIGQAGRIFAENNFDIKKVAQEYEKIYAKI